MILLYTYNFKMILRSPKRPEKTISKPAKASMLIYDILIVPTKI